MELDIRCDNPEGLTQLLGRSRVGVAGAGGIGSNLTLALARTGVGSLRVVDRDIVEARNLNRQAYTLEHLGMAKTEALESCIRAIDPALELSFERRVITGENAAMLFERCDVLVEALDEAETKAMLIEQWLSAHSNVPIVACSGVSGYGRSNEIRIERDGYLYLVGDFHSELSMGTTATRVGLVAMVMANLVVELLSREGSP